MPFTEDVCFPEKGFYCLQFFVVKGIKVVKHSLVFLLMEFSVSFIGYKTFIGKLYQNPCIVGGICKFDYKAFFSIFFISCDTAALEIPKLRAISEI